MPANPPPRYESTISPTPIDVAGPEASGHLGKRDDVGLQAAFIGAAVTDADQNAALEYARAVMSRTEDVGANPMFRQFRKNFVPDPSYGPEYEAPRDKTMTDEQIAAAKLGTPYTPTIASPGVGNGVDPTQLRSVKGEPSSVMAAGATPLDNPTAGSHLNTDNAGNTTNIGTVRRFKLGVGSGASGEPRGQFPRPPR